MDKKRLFGLIVLIFSVFCIYSFIYVNKSLNYSKVVFFDVGQGDAIFIETPNHVQVLIDGGSDRKILERLGQVMPFFDRTIDYVFFSHPDQDHIGGLIPVLDKYEVKNVVQSGVLTDTEIYKTLLEKIQKEKSELIVATAGDIFDLDNNVSIKVLFPDRDAKKFETNTASLVLQIDFGDIEILLTGDLPKAVENYLVQKYGDLLQSEILKAGHHGSKTSNSQEFLTAVSPEFFAISVGAENKYGHPNEEVLNLAQSLGLEILRTDLLGDIKFKTDGLEILY